MHVMALIPFGPGHEDLSNDAVSSVLSADVPTGWSVDALTMDDSDGALGRSQARNRLAAVALEERADWLFYLDADDLCDPKAFTWLKLAIHDDPELEVLWGRVVRQRAWRGSDGAIQKLEVMRSDDCVAPIRTREHLLSLSGHSTLRVGNFVRPDLHERVGGWLEDWDVGEDHEYHYACAMNARCFAKIDETLAWIRTYLPGAHGPRGYVAGDPRIAGHYNLGEDIAQYWRDRDGEPWVPLERSLRLEGELYGLDRSRWGTGT